MVVQFMLSLVICPILISLETMQLMVEQSTLSAMVMLLVVLSQITLQHS